MTTPDELHALVTEAEVCRIRDLASRATDAQTQKALYDYATTLEYATPPGPDWIPCSERMPPCPKGKDALGTEVLVYPRGTYPSAFYGKRATGKPAFYLHGAELYDVTHWMPLPTPPKDAK